MALYMGNVKIAGIGSGSGGSYELSAATSDTLGGIKIGLEDTDDKLGVKLDSNKRAYVMKVGGTATCNYNSNLSNVISGLIEDNNAEIRDIVQDNNDVISNDVSSIVKSNNSTIQGYVTGNNSTLSSLISSIVNDVVEEKMEESVNNSGWDAEFFHYVSSSDKTAFILDTGANIEYNSTISGLFCCPYATSFAIDGTSTGKIQIGTNLRGIGRCSSSDFKKSVYMAAETLTFHCPISIYDGISKLEFPYANYLHMPFSGHNVFVINGYQNKSVREVDVRSLTSSTYSSTGAYLVYKITSKIDARSLSKSNFPSLAAILAESYSTGVVARCSDGNLVYNGSSWVDA